jgi:hypothetical protein
MVLKTYFFVAVVVAGVTEWLKNFLPAKVVENNKAMAGIAGAMSVVGSLAYIFINKAINPDVALTWQNIVVFTAMVVGLVQVSYNVLVQTFKAVKTKLTQKAGVDPETAADEIADKVIEGITSEVTGLPTTKKGK